MQLEKDNRASINRRQSYHCFLFTLQWGTSHYVILGNENPPPPPTPLKIVTFTKIVKECEP